jgi:hypothetical protein
VPDPLVLSPDESATLHRPLVLVGGLFGFAVESYGLGHFTETRLNGRAAVCPSRRARSGSAATIVEAIRGQGHVSIEAPEAVGSALQVGTNCGSYSAHLSPILAGEGRPSTADGRRVCGRCLSCGRALVSGGCLRSARCPPRSGSEAQVRFALGAGVDGR